MKIKHLLILVVLTLLSCDPIEWNTWHTGFWYIKNLTDNDLKITYSQKHTDTSIVLPKDSICIYGRLYVLTDNDNISPAFDDFLAMDSIYVYDSNGNILNSWIQEGHDLDQADIYNESSWKCYKNNTYVDGYTIKDFTWTFEITDPPVE